MAARTASVCWINHTQLQLYAIYVTELHSSKPYTLPEDTSLQMWPARPGQTSNGAELGAPEIAPRETVAQTSGLVTPHYFRAAFSFCQMDGFFWPCRGN